MSTSYINGLILHQMISLRILEEVAKGAKLPGNALIEDPASPGGNIVNMNEICSSLGINAALFVPDDSAGVVAVSPQQPPSPLPLRPFNQNPRHVYSLHQPTYQQEGYSQAYKSTIPASNSALIPVNNAYNPLAFAPPWDKLDVLHSNPPALSSSYLNLGFNDVPNNGPETPLQSLAMFLDC